MRRLRSGEVQAPWRDASPGVVEFDRGDHGGGRDRGGEVPSAMGDPVHDATRTHVVPRPVSAAPGGSWPRELAITLGGALTYFGLRVVVEGDRATAVENAERLLKIERALAIDIEQTVQASIVDNGVVRTLGNVSYVWLHWPLLIAVFVVLYRVRPDRFFHLRRAMFWSGAVGLIMFTVVPTAPPRFLPGFVGTVSDDARRHYLTYPLSWTNQVAAVPSFHAGWTLIACLALASVLARPAARVAAIVPAVLVLVSVVTTGNHYILDTVLGTAIAVVAYVLADPDRGNRARRAAAPRHAFDDESRAGRHLRTSCSAPTDRRSDRVRRAGISASSSAVQSRPTAFLDNRQVAGVHSWGRMTTSKPT